MAIVALGGGLSPLLHMVAKTRPFWTGHPLHQLGVAIDAVPVLSGPMIGLILGGIAWYEIRRRRQTLTGEPIAAVAVIISTVWLALFTIVILTFAMPTPS
jgi:hypothetical protein